MADNNLYIRVLTTFYFGWTQYNVFRIIPALHEAITLVPRSANDSRRIHARLCIILQEARNLRRNNRTVASSRPRVNSVIIIRHTNIDEFIDQFTAEVRALLPTLRNDEAFVVCQHLERSIYALESMLPPAQPN